MLMIVKWKSTTWKGSGDGPGCTDYLPHVLKAVHSGAVRLIFSSRFTEDGDWIHCPMPQGSISQVGDSAQNNVHKARSYS